MKAHQLLMIQRLDVIAEGRELK